MRRLRVPRLTAALLCLGLAACDSASGGYIDENRAELARWFGCDDYADAPLGGSVQGVLTDDDCHLLTATKYNVDHYVLEISEQTMVEIELDMGGGAQPVIALRTTTNDNPGGSPRQTREAGGMGQVARMDYEYLPGVSVISVTTLGAGETGPYTLSIRER